MSKEGVESTKVPELVDESLVEVELGVEVVVEVVGVVVESEVETGEEVEPVEPVVSGVVVPEVEGVEVSVVGVTELVGVTSEVDDEEKLSFDFEGS